MSPQQQQLLAALHALYHHEDPKVKDEADRWLEAWQQSVEAWSVADAVLHDPSCNMEAQYFCAQTLRTKVQRDFEELPEHALDSLRDSLLTLLVKYSKGAPPVRTQLCLALASMAVHFPAGRWGEGGVVRWFGAKLQAVPVDLALPCLLELLTVLPQEVHSVKVAVRPERRRQYAQELASSLGMALEMLTSCLGAAPGDRTKEQALEAYGAWLRLSGGKNLPLTGAALATHPLTTAALGSLSSSDTFYAAVDAVCELVWVTVDANTKAINDSMMPLVQRVVPAVMELRPRFAIAARRAAAEQNAAPNQEGEHDNFDDDEDTAKGMARLFAEVAEAYIALVASAVQEVRAPVEAMLEVTAYPDFNIASMSFNFWAKLARQLRGRSREGGTKFSAPASAAPTDASELERQRRVEFFKPAFEKLVTQIRGRLRYPEKWSSWSREDHAEFKRQRVDIADTLEDSAGVIGFSRTLQLLLEPMQQLSSDVAAGLPFDWRAAEAALHCIRSISYHATDPSDVALLQLLHALPGLPDQEPQLQYTACQVVAQYAPWLNTAVTAGRPDAITLPPRLVEMAVASLGRSESAAAGARALSALADHCGAQLLPCMDRLVSLYHTVLHAGSCSTVGAVPPPAIRAVHEEDVHQILGAVCTAATKCLPPDQLRGAATALLQPILDMLQRALEQLPPTPLPQPPPLQPSSLQGQQSLPPPPPYPPPPSLGARQHIPPITDRLTTVLQGFQRQDIVAQMLGWSWPLLNAVLQRCSSESVVLEHVCRALRYGVKGAGKACEGVLPALLDEIPRRFRETRHSALLYIFSELVKTFGDHPGCDSVLAPVLQQLLAESCQGLQGLQQMEQHPDLVDDTLLLVTRALAYCPRIVLAPPATALSPLLNMAMLGVLMQHREACCSALAFICRLLEPRVLESCPPGAAEARQAELTPRGPMLTRLLLAGVAGCVPFSRIQEISAALTALLRASGQTGAQWLGAALAALPDGAVAQSDKQALLDAGSSVAAGNSMRQDDEALDAALGEFGDLCRRTKRVMQQVQAALLPPELAPHFRL